MNILDEIGGIVRSTPISDIDMRFIQNLDVKRVYDQLENKPEYRSLIDSMMGLFLDAERRGVPKERAIAVVLGTHEDMVRYVIMKALKERILALGLDKIVNGNVALQYDDFMAKLEVARKAMEKLDAEFKEKASKPELEQFRAYLRYAADRFGNASEKRAIASLVKKIVPSEATQDANKTIT